jgi:hypothetical protein
MDSIKYIGMDVHKETISIAVLSARIGINPEFRTVTQLSR